MISVAPVTPSGNACVINGETVATVLSGQECDALIDFYVSTGGPNWVDREGWATPTDPCTWVGVECRGSSVVTIAHQENNLRGALPASLNQLSGLNVLVLNDNELEGSIPDLGSTALNFLDLQSNNLSGAIPATLGDVTGLAVLAVLNNNLSGPIPPQLGNLSLLWVLSLSGNNLTGQIPDELNSCLLYTSPSPRDRTRSRMPSSA